MDDFLNKLKARTEHLELSDHKGVDEDALWANIEGKIAGKEETKKKRGFLFFLSFLLMAIFFIGGIGIYFNKNIEAPIQKENRNLTEQNSIVETQDRNSILNTPTTDKTRQSETQDKDILIKKTTEESITKSSPNQLPANHTSKIQDKTAAETNIISTKKPIAKSGFASSSELIKSTDKVIADDPSLNKSNKIVEIKRPSNNSVIEKQPIKTIEKNGSTLIRNMVNTRKSIVLLPSMIQTIEAHDPIESLDAPKIYRQKKGMKVSLGLYSGIHFLHSNFKNNTSESQERTQLLNAGFKPQLGYSLSAEVILKLTKKLRVTTGIEYIYSIEQFNYENSWDTTFQSQQNSNITINRLSERKVIHHNRHALLSVPILLGGEIQKGRFGLGVNLGIGLNFIQSQKGKSLSNNLEIIEFPSADNNLSLRPNFFLSYNFSPYLNYQLDKHLKFQIRSNFKYQNYKGADFYQEMKFSSILTGMQVGLIMDILK